MFLIILLTYLYSHSILAAPTTLPILVNSDVVKRSIPGIIWGCLTTLFACSWVAVHPNISPPGSTGYQTAMIRTELMIWTIVAPECILYWAARQYIGARNLKNKYKKRNWTRTHGYFLQMGGFVAEGKDITEVLSPNRFEGLLERNIIAFPEISEGEIQDRSKADSLAKLLALVQVFWFMTQCAARVLQGLAITQLELITFASASLTGIMYCFWWNKPFNVRLPIKVHMLGRPMTDGRKDNTELYHGTLSDSALSESISLGPDLMGLSVDSADANFSHTELNETLEKIFTPGTASITKAAMLERLQLFCGYEDNPLVANKTLPIFFCSSVLIEDDIKFSVSISVAGMIFAGMQCAGWRLKFPSSIEQSLWTISSLIVSASPAIQFIVQLLGFISTTASKNNHEKIHTIADKVWKIVSILGMLFVPFYACARYIIIAEAFAALRDVPHSATAIVEWTTFIPHVQ